MSNLVVQTNVMALNSHRNLTNVGTTQAKASARLSSGYRINSAADDATGLAISEKMRSQIRGLDQASKNAQDGISLVQTAEGGMQEIDNMLQRVRELLVDVSNDSKDNPSLDRKKVQDEIDQLVQGIDAMATQVEFNKKKLIDGTLASESSKSDALASINANIAKNFGSFGLSSGSFGCNADALISIGNGAATFGVMGDMLNKMTGISIASGISVGGINIATVGTVSVGVFNDRSSVDEYLGTIDKAISDLKTAKELDATQMVSVGTVGRTVSEAIGDLEKLKAAVEEVFTQKQVINAQFASKDALTNLSGGNNLWFQTGANESQGIKIGIGSLKSDILGIGNGEGTTSIDVRSDSGADINWQIAVLDNAISYVTAERSKLGAVQNRMEYTKTSLDISSENLSNAESRVRDADMAKEMMSMTAANVLQQAGVSMLSQANQAPQSILQLLR